MTYKVLIEGYAKTINFQEHASSTATLINDGTNLIIVDPGTNRQKLIDALKQEKLTPSDINYVILTHTHLDHSLLVGMFDKASILDGEFIYSWDGKILDDLGILGENIIIFPTPGHDQFHQSVLLKNTDKGNVVISGDVFWWWGSEKQELSKEALLNREDPYVKNKEQLLKSRLDVLEIADYVIPGHGKEFKVS